MGRTPTPTNLTSKPGVGMGYVCKETATGNILRVSTLCIRDNGIADAPNPFNKMNGTAPYFGIKIGHKTRGFVYHKMLCAATLPNTLSEDGTLEWLGISLKDARSKGMLIVNDTGAQIEATAPAVIVNPAPESVIPSLEAAGAIVVPETAPVATAEVAAVAAALVADAGADSHVEFQEDDKLTEDQVVAMLREQNITGEKALFDARLAQTVPGVTSKPWRTFKTTAKEFWAKVRAPADVAATA